MFQYGKKVLSNLFRSEKQPSEGPGEEPLPACSQKLSQDLYDNLKRILNESGNPSDLNVHNLYFGEENKTHACLLYVLGMVNIQMINDSILRPLSSERGFREVLGGGIETIASSLLWAADIKTVGTLSEVINEFIFGNAVLLVEGCDQALSIGCKGWEKRSVTEPQTEAVVRGPREGFTENFFTNTSLIRRKIKSPSLRMERMKVGRRTKTDICLVYLYDVADPQIVETVRERIKGIDTDVILESGYVEQFIEDSPFGVFPTIGNSEKPDVVAGKILEGRIAVVVEGTPFVLTIPMLFWEGFQTSEDYYMRFLYANGVRVLRFVSFLITVLAPSLYVALATFHHELLPTRLLFTMAQAREGIPFPAVAEALLMVLAFEILREAGLRLPRPVGQAVSIVGALIMGEAAVSAGFVGSTMVIIMAITAVAGFVVITHSQPAAILRLYFIFAAGTFGGFGVAMCFLLVYAHLAKLESFGVPYLTGIGPIDLPSFNDIFARAPLWMMRLRPGRIATGDQTRTDSQHHILKKKDGGGNAG